MFRWFIRNVTTLFLSIAIAITIWIVALNEADPCRSDSHHRRSLPSRHRLFQHPVAIYN
ncbi:MAG: hypothetical protein HZC38_04430 [Chloroflexi bacterium]|nr:hypothetical protein [Chloroflexota bacterium]